MRLKLLQIDRSQLNSYKRVPSSGMTYRVEGIKEKTQDVFVEVSPELSKERGIQSGTWVQLHPATEKFACVRWSPTEFMTRSSTCR